MSLSLLDFRRRTAEIYRQVRATSDPEQAHALWVRERRLLYRDHPDSAYRGELRHAPYDPALRFVTPLHDAPPARIEVATATDGVVPFERIGAVELGAVGSLDVWWLASYGGGVWLPMRDRHPQTYGGGRYVLDTVKGADLGGDRNALVVDLNFAYNPSCVYDESWACPLAPPGNVLEVGVPAGELLPGPG